VVAVLVITAPVGGGKTAVMFEASDVLNELGLAHAIVDVDALSWCYPRPNGDQFGSGVALRNLAHVWREYAALDTPRLMVARVMESRGELDSYSAAIPDAFISIARLHSSAETIHSRLRNREPGLGVDRDIGRATQLIEQMEADPIEDFVIDNDGRPIREVAVDLLDRAGWT